MIEFTSQPATGDGTAKREYVAVTDAGTYLIRHEATTHAYPRGASNPRWFIHHGNGQVGTRQRTPYGTLAAAIRAVESQVVQHRTAVTR